MRLVLIGLISLEIVNGYYQPRPFLRLQKLESDERKVAEGVESTIRKWTNYIHLLTSRFKALASARSVEFSREDYSSVPILALIMIRRLWEDWISLANMVNMDVGLHQLGLSGVRWPSYQHLDAAALSVVRTQWTYSLDIQHLTDGMVTGKRSLINVTAADCLHISSVYWTNSFFDEGIEWFIQALHNFINGDLSISRQTVLRHLRHLNCFPGETKNVLLLMEVIGRNTRCKFVITQEELQQRFKEVKKNNCSEATFEKVIRTDLELHKSLCSTKEKVSDGLRCRFVHYQQPHLRFQPFKLEELHLDPPVLRFYDVITDTEAEIFKNIALKSMDTAKTFSMDGTHTVNNYRKSQIAWIGSGELEANDQLNRRMEDITQLNVGTAEDSQVSRYSISGEYLLHYDFLKIHGYLLDEDRIATLMFYLNDVIEGGNTVFFNLNISVRPVKNSAIFWFNYLPSGELDFRTLHSGCPVLYGSKWVINKWFRNEGQEFSKPCGLTPYDSFTHYYMY